MIMKKKTQTHSSNISGNHTYRNIFQFKPDTNDYLKIYYWRHW